MSYGNILLTVVVIVALGAVVIAFRERNLRQKMAEEAPGPRPAPSAPDRDLPLQLNGREGVEILQGRNRLTDAYEELRTRQHLNRVLAVWSADYGEIEDYFANEAAWLTKNPKVTVERVVVAQPEEHALLSELAGRHENLRLYTSTTKNSEFELYICEYNHPEALETRAGILVVNNMASSRPEFGILIDAQAAPELSPFVATLGTWFEKLPREVVKGRKGDEDVWTLNSALYDSYVDRDSSLPFLRDFIRSEDRHIVDLIAGAPADTTVVEFGSGTGRTIHYLRSQPAIEQKVEFFIGFDHSAGMIQESQTKRGNSGGESAARTFFFTLDGAEAFQNFWDGHLSLSEGLNDTLHLSEHPLDVDRYEQSDRVICCLLNTLGVLDRNTRRKFAENLFLAATESDTVVISVFDRGAFSAYAQPLYENINPLVGTPVDDYLLNSDDAEFRAGSYFSHWFGEDELRELVTASGGSVEEILAIKLRDGVRIGHFAICRKARRGPLSRKSE